MLAVPQKGVAAGDAAADPILRVESLGKFFRRSDQSLVPAVDDVSMEVRAGEFVVLLGPSGCGKTTLLRCIGGLERPDRGVIEIEGRTVYSSSQGVSLMPEDRHIGMVFQSYALWPHMTVFDNVAYPLRARRLPKADIPGRVREALAMVGIPELEKQYPSQMSGGQQQRVALARAIVSRSRLILFDEPLSNVDAKVREQLRDELVEMQRKLHFAAVYVTHDQEEAIALGDRIAALRKGKIAQIGSPRDLYLTPRSLYVANFIGTTNNIHGIVESFDGGLAAVRTEHGKLRALAVVEGLAEGDQVAVVFRPERCSLTSAAVPGGNAIPVTFVSSAFMGAFTQHHVQAAGRTLETRTIEDHAFSPGQPLWLCGQAEHFCVLPAE
jgi:iron(III) transport system ATP-binding protein